MNAETNTAPITENYHPSDAPWIIEHGTAMKKKPNPVYLVKQENDFIVATNEGFLRGKAGDFVAHDPISGHVWPVAASYVEQHYEPYVDPMSETLYDTEQKLVALLNGLTYESSVGRGTRKLMAHHVQALKDALMPFLVQFETDTVKAVLAFKHEVAA